MTNTRLTADWLSSRSSKTLIAALERVQPECVRFVGGCVRNALMDRPVDDIDVATQLTPDQVLEALKAASIRAEPTGMEHGTITAIIDREPFEITSLRRDVETDGRRAVVAFTTDWAEDAMRRDFRLNALYASPDGTLHDPSGGGIEDAATGRVIFIGDADDRLREDYLRILRFFRFNAWYGAGIDPNGLAACARQAGGLEKIAVERIWREMEKLLRAPDPGESLTAMEQSGVLAFVIPGMAARSASSAITDLLKTEHDLALTPDPLIRLMALSQRDTETVTRLSSQLRLPNASRDRLQAWAAPGLTAAMMEPTSSLAAKLYRFGRQPMTDWAISDNQPDLVRLIRETPLGGDFPISGRDLLDLGMGPGRAVGLLLRELEDWWLAGELKANREDLLREARQRFGSTT